MYQSAIEKKYDITDQYLECETCHETIGSGRYCSECQPDGPEFKKGK